MKAVRIHRFGPPDVIVIDDLPTPAPSEGEVLIRVAAAGVGPWDALIREGGSKVSPQPPLTLGSDLSGRIEAIGPGVTNFNVGDEVYGVTNPQFVGAQAEYAIASAAMIAPKPKSLTFLEAASVPVIAVTAYQMLFEYAGAKAGDTVLITGAAGNVGAYAVQLALHAGIRVVAVARPVSEPMLRKLGAQLILDSAGTEAPPQLDAVLDAVGGSTVEPYLPALKPEGKLVSAVSDSLPGMPEIKPIFFYADVTTSRLQTLSKLFEDGSISARTGSILPLAEARASHDMLAGAPHEPGKILLRV